MLPPLIYRMGFISGMLVVTLFLLLMMVKSIIDSIIIMLECLRDIENMDE